MRKIFFIGCYIFTAGLSLSLYMDREQFTKMAIPLRKRLALYSRSFLEIPEDAEDVVQEVLMKLWCMRKELDHYDNIQALATQITKHLCLNRIKIIQRKTEDIEHFTFVSALPSPHIQLEQKDEVEHVMKIIDKLPELQQSVLRMKHIDGLEIDEIAGMTGCNPESVRMNLSRARKKVKELFFNNQNG